MTDASIWNKPIPVPASVISYVDKAIQEHLPPENKIVSIVPSGSSYWARTAKIETEKPDGEEESFFIKVQQGDYGNKVFTGEFASMKALYEIMPDLVPKPIAMGHYAEDHDKWFFLCAFHEMIDDVPDVEEFSSMISELHKRGESPDGKFGFPVPTYGGRLPMIYPVSSTWEELFTEVMNTTFDVEEHTQGFDEDMRALRNDIMKKVVPRLLRPMETEGRKLVPRLVHSDLWHGNVGVDVNTNLPVIFDALALYAHNEYELAPWRPIRHNIGRPYINEYLRHFPATEPAVDFEDRNLLYCIKFNLNSSAHYPGNLRFRNISLGCQHGPDHNLEDPVAEASAPNQQGISPYTTLGRTQRRCLTYLLGILCLVSSLSATIYFPLVPLLASQYSTSLQAVNLTITLYIIFQGLAPSFWSPLSDHLGRRPVFLATFGVYTAASIGLSVSSGSYAALASLRALQSIGGSAVLSISYGVVADVSTHAERGSMLGPMLASGNLGPCLGPLIGGGAIFATGEPVWCFRVLIILGGICFLLIGWTLPETNRTVVDNGSVASVGIWRTWWDVLAARLMARKVQKRGHGTGEKNQTVSDPHGGVSLHPCAQSTQAVGRGKIVIPNPFASLLIVLSRNNALILFLAASPYTVWYLIQTSVPSIYGRESGGYGFNDVNVGLCYLTGGAGVITGGFAAGRMMDYNYKAVARRAGLPVNRQIGDSMQSFPIEEARSRWSIAILFVSVGALVGYGWAVQHDIHPSVPLLLQFYIGAKCTVLHQAYSALLVDIHPDSPSTAAASNNLVRCALSAAAVAALQPLVDVLNRGWFFTMVGLLDGGLCIIAVVVLRTWGQQWRNRKVTESTLMD
ncbi:hypothetical protein TruAng_009565 [Truncatella angustata]|nr:hypothetical protein TruAng_009565 [Truncatella angustata]